MIIAVVGTTATGKTALGVELAQQLNGEVISADSRVVYRKLDIGTAKPTPKERQGIPHHLIDLVNPDETYSVSMYQKTGSPILNSLLAQEKTPIIVGGTGLYVRALLQESFFPDIPPDGHFRNEMAQLAQTHGTGYLHQLLTQKDPRRAAQLHPNDQVRIIRALEIIEKTGNPVPDATTPLPYNVCWLGLAYDDRDLLRQRIAQRMESMLSGGWIEEVEGLLKQYGPDAQALKVAHGYPELVKMLQGELSLDEARYQIQINTQQYARRQITWFRPNTNIHWFNVDKIPPENLVNTALEYIKQYTGT